MSAVYLPSIKFPLLYAVASMACVIITFADLRWAPVTVACLAFCLHRLLLHSQSIELTPVGLVSRTLLGEAHLPYRQICAMNFASFTGDLLVERPWVKVRIPRQFAQSDEIRRALSLAIWAHRGGEVSPDFTGPNTAFV